MVQPEGVGSVPIDASKPRDTALTDFKVVGYYPSWKPDKLQSVDFGVLTHVCYAFIEPSPFPRQRVDCGTWKIRKLLRR